MNRSGGLGGASRMFSVGPGGARGGIHAQSVTLWLGWNVLRWNMNLFRGAGVLAAVLLPAWLPARAQEAPANVSDRAEIVHVLNRLTFGPRQGDVAAVEKMGLRAYIEQQLHPETIDDSAVDQEIAQFDLLQMSGPQLAQLFYDEAKARRKEQKLAAAAGTPPVPNGAAPAPAAMTESTPPASTDGQPMAAANASMNPNGATPETPSASPHELRQKPGKLKDALAKAAKARTVEAIGEMEEAKLVRAVDSRRQLQEVLVDFWENHFNVDAKKGPDRVFEITEDRDVIRPHLWGKFRDLLEATAKSPAMLFYLDNATNTVQRVRTPAQAQMGARLLAAMGLADAPQALEMAAQTEPKKIGGINENYGREVMELHTIGVNAGYTQTDVQEVARCFTGWTIDHQTGEFIFRPRLHDNGSKTVLGHEIPAGGGIQDGETVLDILASSPACAHFISREMCQRFVGDDPPAALVDHIAGVFTQTQGDLRAVTEAIITSPEFFSPSSFNNKIKSPLEFAVSAVRASDSTLATRQPAPWDRLVPTLEGAGVLGRAKAADRLSHAKQQSLNWHVVELGEPLYACTPPTGYGEDSKKWVSPGALIERLNFALALTQQQVSDVAFDAQKILGGIDLDHPDQVLNRCIAVLLDNNITDTTRAVLAKSAVPAPGTGQTVNPSKLIALILGSPEFQRK
jgi:uncharacterized protein (DUF1800 family)